MYDHEGGWNITVQEYGEVADLCVHQVFERWVKERPTLAACRFERRQLTYDELNAQANRLARHLNRLGVGRESVVGVLLDRGLELPVALLGILKAGAGYLPLDIQHPRSRLEYLVRDAACEVVVTAGAAHAKLPDDVLPVRLDDASVAAALTALADDNPGFPVHPDNLAYLLYTSGTTGAPKGTLVQHRSVVNLAEYCRREYRLEPPDRILQFASPSFDVSVFDFFAAWCNGITLVQGSRLTLLDPRALTALIRDEKVTVMDIPPAVARLLETSELPDLRAAHIGGEALAGELADRFQAPHRQVRNTYGPTEVTVTSTDYLCPPGLGEARPPIGRPIANLTAHVVDGDGNPVRLGEPGELLMGGVGVARGYHGRPALTAERFVPDPYGPPGARLYHTGDLVRRRPDGHLEFLDRIDTQLKVNGHRVEPGEIEAVLCRHPAVREAVVDLIGSAEDPTLVAFLVVDREAPTTEEVRAHARAHLPTYMIPARTVVVEEIPLTTNGKVDRRTLRNLVRPE
ncbi:amino acid adenylation domain-containing protein [Streptomyces apocyni]|uniref:amino acid adenylation domain-containing protein n=1 Tax=Streptomyces apocyni TaxID=2654677 RepID=UPI0012EA7274|nr:amino acid adenylation domain-containing protein [Streptomyces apocyni]